MLCLTFCALIFLIAPLLHNISLPLHCTKFETVVKACLVISLAVLSVG